MWEQVLSVLCSPSHAVILNCSLVKMDGVGSLSYWFWETSEGVVLNCLHLSVGGKMASCVLSSCLSYFLAHGLGQML